MRLSDDEQRPLSSVFAELTVDECRELVSALEDLLDRGTAGPQLHHHVSSADHQTEITVWLSEAGD